MGETRVLHFDHNALCLSVVTVSLDTTFVFEIFIPILLCVEMSICFVIVFFILKRVKSCVISLVYSFQFFPYLENFRVWHGFT
jgi:hypothetical protein